MISSHFLKVQINNTGIIEHGNEVAHKEEGESGEEQMRNSLLPTCPFLLETLMES